MEAGVGQGWDARKDRDNAALNQLGLVALALAQVGDTHGQPPQHELNLCAHKDPTVPCVPCELQWRRVWHSLRWGG